MATSRKAVMSEEPGDTPQIPDGDEEEILESEEQNSSEEASIEAVEEDDDDGPVSLEDLDPITPLFENGPTVGEIIEWKKVHGSVYVTSFDIDQHYVWRPITRFEYRRLVKQMEQAIASNQVTQAEANMNNEEAMCELCILWPKLPRSEMAGEMAGVASIISQEIMEASAFVALDVRQL